MDISTVKTIISIIPTEKPNEREYVPKTFIPHTVTEERLFQEYQLKMTVDNKTSTWIVDQVKSRFQEETATCVDSALLGYNATYLSLSVSDEYKESLYKQRKQNLQDLFDTLKSRIQSNPVSIEYAYLGIKDNECYDIRKKISRTNLSVLKRGMDAFMRSVDSIDDIISIIEKEPIMPSILNIRLTHVEKGTTGRLVIVDLLHPRFTPLLPGITNPIHASFDYLQFVVDKLNTPDCKEEIKTNTSVLTNEIGKYICGKNKLLVVGYINDKIVNEIHSNETRSLLSFVSSFKNIPIRSLPNKTISDTFEYKHLLSEKRTLEHQSNQIVSINNHLQQQITQKGLLVNNMESHLNSLRTESTQHDEKAREFKEKSALFNVKEKQVTYLKSTLKSKAPLYKFDTLKIKADIVRLKTMLDIKEFAEEDILSETQSKKRRYQENINTLQDKISEYDNEVQQLEVSVKELQHQVSVLKSQDTITAEDTSLEEEKKVQHQLKVEELKTTIEKRKRTLQENQEENKIEKINLNEKYERFLKTVERDLARKKKEVKDEVAAVKEKANDKLNALNRSFQDRLADQEKEIEKLSQQLLYIRAPNRRKD